MDLTGTTLNVTILNAEMNSIEDLRGTGLKTIAEELLNEHGIEEVTIEGLETKVTVNLNDPFNEETINQIKALRDKFGEKAGDLIGKELKVNVKVKDGCIAVGATEYKILFQ